MSNIYKKLLNVQKKLGAVSKDQSNPFFNSKYADINKFIEVVKPVLSEEGLVLTQPLTYLGEAIPAIRTCITDADTGEDVSFMTPIITKETDTQKIGSAITYYRRYALQSFLFIEAQDDDGNAASGKKTQKDDSPF